MITNVHKPIMVKEILSFLNNDKDLSKALSSSFSSTTLEGITLKSSDMNSDIHASAEFRASLIVTHAKKAVEAC